MKVKLIHNHVSFKFDVVGIDLTTVEQKEEFVKFLQKLCEQSYSIFLSKFVTMFDRYPIAFNPTTVFDEYGMTINLDTGEYFSRPIWWEGVESSTGSDLIDGK
jgi:hypothetical protein